MDKRWSRNSKEIIVFLERPVLPGWDQWGDGWRYHQAAGTPWHTFLRLQQHISL